MSCVCPPRDASRFLLPMLALAICLGCTKDTTPTRNTTTTTPGPAVDQTAASSTPSDAAQAGAVAEGGVLKGTITFDGEEIPRETMLAILTDPQYCDKHGKDGYYPAEDYLIDPETRGIRYVMVSLTGAAVRKWANTPKQNLVLDNRNCRFEPHVAVSTVGSMVEVKNSDDVYHTTHLYGPPGFREFNPGLQTKGASETTELTRPGLYQVKCDKHGWMRAFLKVDDHPFHAITDEKGRFEITGIPPGTHQVEIWHEQFGGRPAKGEVLEVTVEADQTATLDLKLSHTK